MEGLPGGSGRSVIMAASMIYPTLSWLARVIMVMSRELTQHSLRPDPAHQAPAYYSQFLPAFFMFHLGFQVDCLLGCPGALQATCGKRVLIAARALVCNDMQL